MDHLDSDLIPRAEHEKVTQALTQRAEAAEAYICRTAIEQAAAKAGCVHPHVMADVLAKQVRYVDGVPRYILTTTADDGEPVEVPRPVEEGIQPYADDPVNAVLFGRDASRAYAADANGRIDVRNLSGADYETIRKTPEGRRALGLE
ncbi:MAG TPA: hypothetical protein VMV10_09665 [Pirellulales bacterium]|nr:hypothetical protein [Pirellulales bacterium]